MADPVADGAFIAQRHRGDMVPCVRRLNSAATSTDHDGDFTFIIQLFGFRRTSQIIAMADETSRKPDKQRRVGRRALAVLVFGVPVRKIHPDANDLAGGRQRGRQRDIGKGDRGAVGRIQFCQRSGVRRIAEAGETAVKAGGQVGHRLAVEPAEARRVVVKKADQAGHLSLRNMLGRQWLQGAIMGCALSSDSRGSVPSNRVPCSNQERGAGAPHRVWRCGSLRSQWMGSWSGSTV